MRRAVLPGPARGLSIGLLGGSFNPAHEGHLHVARTAMRRLKLDAVWWIVARGNPLKSDHGSYAARLASVRKFAKGHRHRVSDIEHRLGLTYSIDTIRVLKAAAPGARFVWLMGADNAGRFHDWKAWRAIVSEVPVAIVARPGARLSRASPFTRRLAASRVRDEAAGGLARLAPPAWAYLRAREHAVSSTALRSRP